MSPERRVSRMLLVEDDEVDRQAVRRALGRTDFRPQLTEAHDCARAREVLLDASTDCVLLDVFLPDGDGITLLREARAAGNDTPIIILTGQGDEALAVELMKAGASDYVPKHLLTPEALTHSIRRAFRLRDAEHRATEARHQLERQALQLQRLARMGAEVHAAPSVEHALELIARLAHELIGAEAGAVSFVARSGGPPQISLSFQNSSPTLQGSSYREGVLFWHDVVRRGKESLRLSAADLEGEGVWSAHRLLHPTGSWRALLAVPLVDRDGAAVGSLQVINSSQGDFSAHDEGMLHQLAHTASVALENAQLYGEAKRATAARDDVLAMVSHDLRNPLAVVRMNASLLREDFATDSSDSGPRLVHLQRIERGTTRMERLIADLLDASCIDAGALAVHPAPERAKALLAEAADLGKVLAEARGCTFIVNEPIEELNVQADRERILQLFSNLIENSLRFIPAEGGRITLSVEQAADHAVFSVRDNGSGVPSDKVGQLFDRFWRADGIPGRGAGLGLFIARGIAEAHGGAIHAESAPSQGTTIRIELPLAAATSSGR